MLLKRPAILAASAVVFGIASLLLCGEIRTMQVRSSFQQKTFLAGRIPFPAPKGFYTGSVPGMQGSPWQGKRFDPSKASGINIFVYDGKPTAKYTFQTSISAGARDPQIQVFRINYNNPKNPWWVRFFLDEVVAVKPGHLLGKLSLEIIPGRPYQMTFFDLQQDSSRYQFSPN